MDSLRTFLVQVIPSLILPSLGVILAVFFLVHLLRVRRPPSSTLAWLFAILIAPYVAIPLYLVLGGRKMKKMVSEKGRLSDRILPLEEARRNSVEETPAVVGGLFPRRERNRIRLLTTGYEAFQALMEELEGAQESIYVTTFILGRDDTGRAILQTLARKARKGVDVRLLLDSLGSWGLPGGFFRDYERAGGKVAFFMPMMHIPFRGRANLRNHRKIVLVDRRTAVLGGMNLAEEYMRYERNRRGWRDLSLFAQGPIVSDLFTVFRSDWLYAADEEIAFAPEPPALPEGEGSIAAQVVPSGPDIEGEPLLDSLITAVVTARERIWIVTPYFVPDEMLQRALCIALRRGVDVRIVVPRVSNHRLADLVRRSYLLEIQKAGGKVYLFSPAMLHGKLIAIDDSLAVVGSSNVDMRSLFLNYEISLFVYSREAVERSCAWAEWLIGESLEGVKPSTLVGELVEGVARLLSPLL
ncbi:PLDc N-terminal domain-containing protein [Candidatus Sumerlaeota bacterium]|nr:PLDc N-terminal domain-containing protein [Candidatus Sumerlaeota bacterium]